MKVDWTECEGFERFFDELLEGEDREKLLGMGIDDFSALLRERIEAAESPTWIYNYFRGESKITCVVQYGVEKGEGDEFPFIEVHEILDKSCRWGCKRFVIERFSLGELGIYDLLFFRKKEREK